MDQFEALLNFTWKTKGAQTPYLQPLFQPVPEPGEHQTHLILNGHVRLARSEQDPPVLHEFRHRFEINLEPACFINVLLLQPGRGAEKLRCKLPLLFRSDHLPVEIERLDKRLTLLRVLVLEPEFEQRFFEPCEPPP